MSLVGHYIYWVTIFLLIAGLYIVFASGNLVKKLIGLGIFQTSVYLLYITPGKLLGALRPSCPSRSSFTPIPCRMC